MIFYLLKSFVCLTIFLIVYQLVLKPTSFFNFNRYYLLFGLILSFILPTINIKHNVVVTDIQKTSSILSDHIKTSPTTNITVENKESPNIWLIVYVAGIGISLIVIGRNLYKVAKIKKEAKCEGEIDGYKIMNSSHVNSPFSFGKTIYLNSQKLSEKEKEIVLKHESAHIKRHHWIDLFCAQCALVLQWFNPLIRIYVHYIKENHEYQADKDVYKTVSPAIYKAVLVNLTFGKQVFSFSNSFNYSKQSNRIKMMETENKSLMRKVATIVLLPLFALFFLAFSKPNYVNGEKLGNGYKIIHVDKKAYEEKNKVLFQQVDPMKKKSLVENLASEARKHPLETGKEFIPIYEFYTASLVIGTEHDLISGTPRIMKISEINSDKIDYDGFRKMAGVEQSQVASYSYTSSYFSTQSFAILAKQGVMIITLK